VGTRPQDGAHSRGEDGDGFCEAHVNTFEGFWSLLRSWLRPHRGNSQEKLPLYLGSSNSCTTPKFVAKDF
jgi:transposase-like protein